MSWHDQSSARFVWTRTWSRNNIAPLCSNSSTLFSSRQNEILMKNRHLNLTGQTQPRTRVNFADTTFSDRKLLLIGSEIQLSQSLASNAWNEFSEFDIFLIRSSSFIILYFSFNFSSPSPSLSPSPFFFENILFEIIFFFFKYHREKPCRGKYG